MKRLSILALAMVLLGCAAERPSDTAPTLETNKAVVRGYMQEIINDGEWTAWDEFFGETVSFNGRAMSRADMEAMGNTFKSIVGGFRMDVEQQVAEGDLVATRVTVSGTHTGDYMGLNASGKDVSFGGLALDRIENGKVVEMWHEMDLWGTLLMASDD